MKNQRPIKSRSYLGVNIHENSGGNRLRYFAFTPIGQVAADTIVGIKQLIRTAIPLK